jgi:hypothetical protein
MNVMLSRVVLNLKTVVHDESESENIETVDLITNVRDDLDGKNIQNFNLSFSLNSLYENLMGCKNLERFELFKLWFLIFENQL